jgi:hypothetical protein
MASTQSLHPDMESPPGRDLGAHCRQTERERKDETTSRGRVQTLRGRREARPRLQVRQRKIVFTERPLSALNAPNCSE